MARPLLTLLSLLVVAGTLSACGGEATAPAESGEVAAAPKRPRVALVMKSLANEFFIAMADGAKAHQARNAGRYELLVNGIRNESDIGQQVALVEQMIAARVDVIVIAPADSRSLLPVVRRAIDAGIVVVNIDNRFDRALLGELGMQVPFVGPDNRDGARAVGEVLAAKLDAGDRVAIIGGIPGAFNARQRELGFRDAMEAAGMEVVASQAADWEQARAATVASAILNEHPGLKGLLCANDSMALGAVAAVRQAGLAGQVSVVGFDNITAAAELVESGAMLATADQHGDQLAVYGIDYALAMLEGAETPTDRDTPVDVITAPGA